MRRGWLGFDPAQLHELAERVAAAATELRRLADDDQAATDALTTARGVAASLDADWLPVLVGIVADRTLTSWAGVAGRTQIVAGVPRPPPDGDDREVAAWWDALSEAERLTAITLTPAAVGNLGGIPAWARDRANRLLLDDDLDRLAAAETSGTLDDGQAAILANARSVRAALDAAERFADPRTGEPAGAQLYVYEPDAFAGDGRAAVAIGDLDAAEHIVIAVPGLGTEVSRFGIGVPRAVFTSAAEHTDEGIAAVTWAGYDAPSITVADGDDRNPFDDAGDWLVEVGDAASVATPGRARRGAERLAADLEGITARRPDGVHLTVLGNSYGSTTVAIAADDYGLAADDVVLTGSPGAGRAVAAVDLTTGDDHTWIGSASDDPVSYLGRTGGAELHDAADFVAGELGLDVDVGLGRDPAEDDFGARRFRAEWAGRDRHAPWSPAGHAHYFDECGESLRNIGAIVAGRYDSVTLAEPRHKDETWDLWDPFSDLVPQDPEADRPVVDGCTS